MVFFVHQPHRANHLFQQKICHAQQCTHRYNALYNIISLNKIHQNVNLLQKHPGKYLCTYFQIYQDQL
jgi:hypothetical protein